jgi:hypothetical protein
MVYISKEDITANIQETMLQTSIDKDSNILDTLERQVIDEVKSYIGTRYDTSKIFGVPAVINGMLSRIIVCLVTYRAIRRNAARKVPDDYVEMKDWAYEVLGNIRDGIMPLPDVPLATDPETGEKLSLFGSNRKPEYFL